MSRTCSTSHCTARRATSKRWCAGIAVRSMPEELSREAIQQRDQSLSWSTEPDGSMLIRGRVPAEVGALFKRARTRRVEALATLAESFLATGPRDLSGADRQQIVEHVDVETLQHRSAGRCELEHGPSIAAETARRLACDASVVRIVEDAKGEPLDVGRRTRTIPPPIRRALNSRDQGCRFPGCTFQRYVDGHHVKHWAEGGETELANLVTLCRFHHRLVHEGQVVVRTLDDGAFRFVRPGGEAFDSHRRPKATGPNSWPRTNRMTFASPRPTPSPAGPRASKAPATRAPGARLPAP